MEKMLTFTPDLRIFANGDLLVVHFDTRSQLDTQRASRCVQISKNFKQLSFAIEGFDAQSITDDLGKGYRSIAGKILLTVTTDVSNEEQRFDLACCNFVLPAIGGKPKRGVFQFFTAEQFEYVVRQGVSASLSAALSEYCNSCRSQGLSIVSSQLHSPPTVSGVNVTSSAANDDSAFKKKLVMSVIAAPILTLLVAWGGSSFFNKSSPIEEAVARQMVQDPESIAAQVELTKQTLKQMGLDPGQSGDIGCLAPQQ